MLQVRVLHGVLIIKFKIMDWVKFEELKGCILKKVSINEHNDEIIFETEDGRTFKMLHFQDCCESVSIDQIDGNFNDLIGEEILDAYESSESKEDSEWGESQTWTFYRISTFSGTVSIKWFGVSNGYYSESVDFVELK